MEWRGSRDIHREEPIKVVRRVLGEDATAIESLVTPTTQLYFGDFSVPTLIERSWLSLCACTESNQIVGVIIFQNNPNVPAIPPWGWEPWIINIYKLTELKSRNTLFINFMVWEPNFKSAFIRSILTYAFLQFPFFYYVVLIAPPNVPTLFFVEEHFERIWPESVKNTKKVQTAYLAVRQKFVTKYKIRRAVEEDNDDIIPMIENHTSRLRELYGDFYVSEMIQARRDPSVNCSKERQLIVAEWNEMAIGVLCLTTKIDYEILNKCFELAVFHGLKKPHPSDEPVMVPENGDAMFDPDTKNDQAYSKETTPEVESNSTPTEISVDHTSTRSESFSILDDVPSYHTDLRKYTNAPRIPSQSFSAQILSESIDTNDIRPGSVESVSLPKYLGADNAFAIELFASSEENERAISSDLIEAAFECYPDRDYCILTVPSTYPPWPLLHCFVRVAPRPRSIYPQELYVLHRNAKFGAVDVLEAQEEHSIAVRNLLHGIRKQDQVWDAFQESLENPNNPFNSYVLTSEKSVVGIAIVCEEDEYEYLSTHYFLNEYIDLKHYPPGNSGLLVHAIVSPIFQTAKRFFLREVLRLSDMTSLQFYLYPADVVDRALVTMVAEMIAVAPIIRPEYHLDQPPEKDPFALYIMNFRHCSIPKMDVNRKLVVVGASSTGLSFLENMVFGQTASFISFTNVTLVSPHGFNHMMPPNAARDNLFPFEGRYNYLYMRQIAIHSYVNLVQGAMTAINRRDKCIVVDDTTIVPYDYLILACGEQYQPPEYALNKEFPENLFIINTEIDGSNALSFLRVLTQHHHHHFTVIVYGSTLEAYCCLASLRMSGISGSHIVFVEPFPDLTETENISLFNNSDVDDIVKGELLKEGIRMYSGYYFKSWEVHGQMIVSVRFESQIQVLDLKCIALFFYDRKRVSNITLSAINRAGLVYDSRLVIDPLYRTNDPNIFSAGSMTKYSRRYYADHLSQKYFNHFEVGARLAIYTKMNLDPTYIQVKETEEEIYMRKVLTPLFSMPLVKNCILAGNLNCLFVTKPGKPVGISTQICKEDFGRVLITGDTNIESQGYFRLHFNQHKMIETITCLTKGVIDVQNTIKLWGKHEKLLNNLLMRYDMVLITDFFEYFREPWMYAIFHESFQESVEKRNEQILNDTTSEPSIKETILQMLAENDGRALTAEQREKVQTLYNESNQRKEIEQNLLDFLLLYDNHLPVYAHPLKTKLISSEFESSPLYRPQ